MRHHADAILHSPSDLVRYLGCAHATALDFVRLTRPEDAPERNQKSDAMGVLVQEAGLAHEEDYRSRLAAQGGLVEIPAEGSLQERAAATIAAMWKGAPAIFQAAFLQSPWHGFADFLVRVEEPSDLGSWSYEPVDTKLARSAKASHIVQLGIYARMIGTIQGRAPARVHVQLGSGDRASFRMTEFGHVLDAAITRYLAFVDNGARGTTPDPCGACSLCPWLDHCEGVWEAEDRLTRIAGLSAPQAERLQAAGIATAAALAASPENMCVPRMTPATFSKLRGQARLQVARMAGGDPVVETLPPEPGRGFANLPKPDAADLFFDLEGDPLEEGGLDYLWGVHYRDGSRPVFRHRWGHDHEAERVAFEDTLDWMTEHLAANPGAHVYHYAPYEITALRRLSTLHASREETLDNLLRSRRFIDLYGVLRQAIRTSEPNLSLKTMEVFFAEAREGEVTKADQSVVEYKSWQATGDEATLQGILDYNRVDCENTEALRDWLVELRMDDLPWRDLGPPAPVADEKAEARAQAEEHAAQLITAIEQGSIPSNAETRTLVGHLTQFHRRADKPAYWAMFDRCEREPEDIVDDGECIGSIEPDPDGDGVWQQSVKRSIEASYRFPPQETKLREGARVLHAPSLMPLGTITALDTDRGTLRVKRMLKAEDAFPEDGSVIPVPTLDNSVLVAAVHRVTGCWAHGGQGEEDGTPRYRALLDILERTGPQFVDGHRGNLRADGQSLIAAATDRTLALDRSALFIQGPPGTGKTHTSAHVICALIAAGKRVGVSSNSHKAIHNLLAKIEDVAAERGMELHGAKKASQGNPDSEFDGREIINLYKNQDMIAQWPDLVAGTAWLFADEDMDQSLDYLFIDEAGQVSLGHLLAMGAAARNIVLVGDQMQLAQPIQGSHPGQSGLSALDYLLEGAATVAPDRGILLDTSWRMHPDICGFISEAVYDGRLLAHPDCARQRLHLAAGHNPALAETGIRFVAMDHTGCGQRSAEEVARVKELAEGLIGTPFTDRNGETATLRWKNILIVAPYNMQVNALSAALPSAARVGTVDKFQGQEAEVVIVSLATSTPDDLPRHVEFFYSKNRINVAISRARTLALVVANPKLLELDAKSVDHLRLVNTLAWVAKEGSL